MTIASEIKKTQDEEHEIRERNRKKMGPYIEESCPHCGRQRVMTGDDGKHRCEKCCWCVEDNNYDDEFSGYMHR